MFLGRSRQVKLYDRDLPRVFVIEFNLPGPPQEHSVNIVFSLM
jgi:hypothetical protein